MGPKYLCCLPLRLGVLINSFFQFLASGAVCGFLVLLLVVNAEGKLKVNDAEVVLVPRFRNIAIGLAVLTGLISLISLTGFIGAIRKKESYVGVYLNLLRLFLLIHVAVVIAFLILFFADKDEFKKLCLDNSTDPQRIDNCNKVLKSSIPAVIVAAILPLLFQAYGVHIVGAYTKKLHMKDSYARVGEESRPLTHHAAYPFSDNSSKV
ncbi:hypothetical protein C8F04DRAFT_1179090 [Mycena alexandri]|uniref:Tetraspanin n=1 Tax=Mycena alexandri TaxID=1745969 RepID=A0AAD6T4G7_9AGAR|nr:hypothetical protein C8F04DRAFT_1179090 [Mycena alexandri]